MMLPRMDSNHDTQIQNLQCYRYTTRHCIVTIMNGLLTALIGLPQMGVAFCVQNGTKLPYSSISYKHFRSRNSAFTLST